MLFCVQHSSLFTCKAQISFLTICKIQVYHFLLYFSHKQPDDGCFVAKTCSCHLKFDLADALFEILEGSGTLPSGTWKYFGVLLKNRVCRIKKLRGN
jgi:hypothetical protein